jgi:hypothetical protein
VERSLWEDTIWTPDLKFWSTRQGLSTDQLPEDPYSWVYINRSATWLPVPIEEQGLEQGWSGIRTKKSKIFKNRTLSIF